MVDTKNSVPEPILFRECCTKRTKLRRFGRQVICFAFTLLVSPGLAKAERPNILLAISDDQSAMHTSFAGDRGTATPAFDRIAKEGAYFSLAFTSCPSCMPSRTSILTGRHMWQTGPGGNLMGVLKAEYPIFSLLLEESGYELGATGKTWGPGRLDGFKSRDGRTLR